MSQKSGPKHICPWWAIRFIDNPVRRLIHPAGKFLAPLVPYGGLVVDVGCGMGTFTMDLARIVGSAGRVVAMDIQEPLLTRLARRARRKKLDDRISTRLCDAQGLPTEDLLGRVDFVLAFYVLHEAPDPDFMLGQIAAMLRPGSSFLLVEPKGHVGGDEFNHYVRACADLGLSERQRPAIRGSHTVLLAL